MDWLNAVVQGVLLGGVYALFACGLSLLYGVMRIINLAHGEMAILAAFVLSALSGAAGMSPFLGLLIVLPGAAAVGWILQRGVLTRSLARGELVPLLATFGLGIVISNALLEVFSSDSRNLDAGALDSASLRVTDEITVPGFGLLVFAAAVAVLGGLQLVLSRTGFGRALRATASDPDTAGLVGIDARAVYAKATAIAIATAALAGACFGMRSSFDPSSGPTQLIFAFEAVIIGGLGSLWGTLVGGVVLGVAQTVGAQIDPAYSILCGHIVFLLVLAFRSQGIFARTVRA